MAHNHGHGDCHDESHDHDHDHPSETGPSDNLYAYIELANVTALNVSENTPGAKVIKPWHERLDETVWIDSDADDQLIVRVPFTGSVNLRSVLLKCGPGEQTPANVRLFANSDHLDFSDIADRTCAQELNIPQGREVGEYAVKPAKFQNVSSVTLFFPSSQGAETIRIYYIGLRGTWTERKRDPVITVYESRANLADHEKIQGTDGGMSTNRLG